MPTEINQRAAPAASKWREFWDRKTDDLRRDLFHVDVSDTCATVTDACTGHPVEQFTPANNAIVIEARLIALVLDRLEKSA